MPWRELITRNFRWKAFSVLLASLIWYNIHSDIDANVSLKKNPVSNAATGKFSKLPVHILAHQWVSNSFKLNPSEVDLTVEGEIENLAKLESRDLRVFVQPDRDSTATTNQAPVQIFAPPGVTVVRITPPVVSIERITTAGR